MKQDMKTSPRFASRDDEVRATLTKEEVIRRIEKLGGIPDESNTDFDVYDQLLACEAINESTPVLSNSYIENNNTRDDVVAYEDGIDGCKQQVNLELTPSKLGAIAKLRELDYRTPPPEIASLLEVVFEGYGTKPGWWLVVAQRWNPRAINRDIAKLVKLHSSGRITLRNPAAYFSFLIQKRKKRRSL
ncbi:hypothetical protein A3D84_03335 [Candidatus Woesebacteria bacterium RIFCSPHIGHO2_02_FULL_42_20]|uniref:Uncharacterized protein n=1 Tax=Candidatus Woesebacteria bacterium RIFCSPHIGHO2_12_FULL_41_24 TaxID=1802510 RepID=A0A1F8ARW9_9BACT|nr:MAG: hypothetical protein A2W15_03525 [Candidatus Woesebacteria bacterium RBG_16_41_13]OGM29915.1 MAG: hypothetical protein A2873_03345 [Candidatus Woesebacteria bacterium RIFCSPHIGHO2_01_FULL_42_80]OGM34874.1 MAG: hypothetical protein A3D84_03335 [Candidatus Woesebacteria bacterium RIFCSPHIGHO2_02_FULL_42_20]OGM54503.1 MAG: hypothetical protein A3E44_00370 [Candidatus Woesebacteria bacterium RIFCSPHIGHO2_12_FULL_41_24]OGM65747.1 MAG: hypothetical protein A2969_00770 [Candidatus Woesebacteri